MTRKYIHIFIYYHIRWSLVRISFNLWHGNPVEVVEIYQWVWKQQSIIVLFISSLFLLFNLFTFGSLNHTEN